MEEAAAEESFRESLRAAQFDEKEIAHIMNSCETLRIEKQAHFLKEGQLCRYAGFVCSGLLMYTMLRNNGEEAVVDFATEGCWVTEYERFKQGQTASLSIVALEPVVLKVITAEGLQKLMNDLPSMERYTRQVLELAFFGSIKRMADLQILKAKERYESFMRSNAHLAQRVPQYHLATYLGIAPQSLSRIRKQMLD